jgi:hypothetical protein
MVNVQRVEGGPEGSDGFRQVDMVLTNGGTDTLLNFGGKGGGGCGEDGRLPYRLVNGVVDATEASAEGFGAHAAAGRGDDEPGELASKLVGALFAKASVRDWASTSASSSE